MKIWSTVTLSSCTKRYYLILFSVKHKKRNLTDCSNSSKLEMSSSNFFFCVPSKKEKKYFSGELSIFKVYQKWLLNERKGLTDIPKRLLQDLVIILLKWQTSFNLREKRGILCCSSGMNWTETTHRRPWEWTQSPSSQTFCTLGWGDLRIPRTPQGSSVAVDQKHSQRLCHASLTKHYK